MIDATPSIAPSPQLSQEFARQYSIKRWRKFAKRLIPYLDEDTYMDGNKPLDLPPFKELGEVSFRAGNERAGVIPYHRWQVSSANSIDTLDFTFDGDILYSCDGPHGAYWLPLESDWCAEWLARAILLEFDIDSFGEDHEPPYEPEP